MDIGPELAGALRLALTILLLWVVMRGVLRALAWAAVQRW